MALTSNLGKIAAGIPDALAWGVEEDAGDVADLARQLVPVRTGQLKSTIRLDDQDGAPERDVIAGELPDTDYAPFVEDDQPFVAPAAAAIRPGVGTATALRRLYQDNAL